MSIRRIPSLNWLRVFEAAARTESFTGAARILNMSPAAVSQQIKALEGHLGSVLFERGARNVTLTDPGASFLPAVRQSLLSVETTAASLFGHSARPSVTIQATLIFATSWLAARLRAFEAACPDTELHVTGSHDERDLEREGPDLHVVFGGAPRNWGDSTALFGEEIYPVALPEIADGLARPGDVLGHRLIEISSHRTSWMQLFAAAGVVDMEQARFCFVDSSEIALAMAARGYGIAVARAPATDRRVEDYGLVPCWPDMRLPSGEAYHLVCRSVSGLSLAAARVRDWLIEEAGHPAA